MVIIGCFHFQNDEGDRVIDIQMMVDQLYELNRGKWVHFFGDLDQDERFIVSTIDMTKVTLPLGYTFDAEKGLSSFHGERIKVVISPSAIDRIDGHDQTEINELRSHQFYEWSYFKENLAIKAKTKEQCEQIDRIIRLTNQKRQAGGLTKRFIDSRVLHLFKKDDWHESDKAAFWIPEVQKIYMLEAFNKLNFLEVVSHEIEHLARYNAARYDNHSLGYIKIKQIGVMIFHDRKSYFCSLNEAITQEAARRTIKAELESNQYYADEVAESERIRKRNFFARVLCSDQHHNEREPSFGEVKSLAVYLSARGRLVFVGDAYLRDRECLKKLVHKLAKYSKQNNEAVYNIFDEASLTGNYLPMARLLH